MRNTPTMRKRRANGAPRGTRPVRLLGFAYRTLLVSAPQILPRRQGSTAILSAKSVDKLPNKKGNRTQADTDKGFGLIPRVYCRSKANRTKKVQRIPGSWRLNAISTGPEPRFRGVAEAMLGHRQEQPAEDGRPVHSRPHVRVGWPGLQDQTDLLGRSLELAGPVKSHSLRGENKEDAHHPESSNGVVFPTL
jgi:hypothetical protein